MTNKALSIFNKLRPVSVGFDSIFDHFENMWDDDFFNLPTITNNYPPYNIVKSGKNKYDVEVALAGFNKKDINVIVEDGMLTIETKKEDKISDEDGDGEVLHKGISKRYFKRSFSVADDVEVKGAKLEDGLLRVSMERKVPEARKLKTIDVK
jgi:molecular chaperone IbpA|tara:strand:- start:20 stop:475 length:456 start_codon:yes stop_codon:yes gene_type:complete